MSGRLKSGQGPPSPLEGPRSPTATSAPQASGTGRPSTSTSKTKPDKQKSRESQSGVWRDAVAAEAAAAVLGREGEPQEEEEVESLVAYREQLRRHMTTRSYQASSGGAKRPSPIQEETGGSPNTRPAEPTVSTASTESGATIRAVITPGMAARTPSYPFPRMATPGGVPSHMHMPFTMLSPTTGPESSRRGQTSQPTRPEPAQGLLDRVLSNPPTPASTLTFLPPGAAPQTDDLCEFPSPNLFDLSLMLTAEPGMDAWWECVVQIMIDVFKAERVTLAVPADTTDIENVPWGQKATYNSRTVDELSLGYAARGSSMGLESFDTTPAPSWVKPDSRHSLPSHLRPPLPSRHSFSDFEANQEQGSSSLRRPNVMPRSKSTFQAQTPGADTEWEDPAGPPPPLLNQEALAEHDAVEETEGIPSWERPRNNNRGRVLEKLQALDYEADPLIDHSGIRRVLERGKVIALTRSYSYLRQQLAFSTQPPEESRQQRARSRSPEGSRKAQSQSHHSHAPGPPKTPPQTKKPRPEASSNKLSSLLGGAYLHKSGNRASHGEKRRSVLGGSALRETNEQPPRPPTPKYEEYEQAPPSPWSQSPAPSPAIRADAAENPFFRNTIVVDEESFNPVSPPMHNYSHEKAPETIGVDNSWTVLHIPLTHILHTRSTQAFKLDASSMERKSHHRGKVVGSKGTRKSQGKAAADHDVTQITPSPSPVPKERQAPIAVISILSPVIPYPSNLRHSLTYLAPHLAASFSLARHYTNLEVEIAGLQGVQMARSETAGFGAFGTDALVIESEAFHPGESQIGGGSITSPSDYSMPSRSATGSVIGTPGWDLSSMGFVPEKRQIISSPLQGHTSDSYFGTSPPLGTSSSAHRPATPGGAPASGLAQAKDKDNDKEQDQEDTKEGAASAPGGERGPSRRQCTLTQSQYETGSEARDPKKEKENGENNLAPAQDPMSPGIAAPATTSEGHEGESGWETSHDAAASIPILSGGTAATLRRRLSRGSSAPRHHTQLHSYGADFSTTFQSLPPSSTIGGSTTSAASTAAATIKGGLAAKRRGSGSVPPDMLPPSDKLKGLILDSLPAHVFVAVPPSGNMVWVNSRYLSYRGTTAAELAADPYASIHPDDHEEYTRAWLHSLRTGEPFSRTVRIRRFDGAYRWFQARAIATRDKRNVAQQFLGSYMDIHDQHTAELKAARQEEIEVSEAKHRLLANLIPQIIFTATEDEGITFANEQWLSYTGQSFDDSLGVGFMDFVHPDDLAKCRIPTESESTKQSSAATGAQTPGLFALPVALPRPSPRLSPSPSLHPAATATASATATATATHSRRNSSSALSSTSVSSVGLGPGDDSAAASASGSARLGNLSKLARQGVIKEAVDSSGRLSYTSEVRLRSKSGEYRWHLIRCVATGDVGFGSGASSYFGSATDINDHKLLEAKLKEAMESKSRFLSNMSHEIRTPLIGISGMVSFLQETTLNEEQLDYTNTIQTSANNLIMIINDILDLSKVDAGMMKLKYEWFHTRSLIEAVNELVSSMAITKRLELNYIVEPDVPAWVKGDKVRIRQVLLNVIGNAIKFTSEGEVFSRCSVATTSSHSKDQSANEIMLEFSVTDTGKGFTKEEAELIFKPFSQIDGSSTRQHGGSGLGLVISRQLVELHGGTMVGSALPNEGSTFTFTARFGLPTEEDHPADATSTSAQAESATLAVPPSIPEGLLAPARPSRFAQSLPSAAVQAKLQQREREGEAVRKSPTSVISPIPRMGGIAGDIGIGGIGIGALMTSPTSADMDRDSPALISTGTSGTSGSSDPSLRSSAGRSTQTAVTQRSSVSSLNQGLVHFSEAARASGQDLSQMKLEMPPLPPPDRVSSSSLSDPTPTPRDHGSEQNLGSDDTESTRTSTTNATATAATKAQAEAFRPLLYSILIISPQTHSREATTKHIEMTLPKDVPHQITSLATAAEARKLIGGDDPVIFTHVVINVPSTEELVGLMDELSRARLYHPRTEILILTDSVQRQDILREAAAAGGTSSRQKELLLSDDRVTYIYKPVKPSRFAVIFDPSQERDLSIDRNRSSAQQMVESQRQSYQAIEARMGNKGYRVLLVEDNVINQKVLLKYLKKVGVEVEVAVDGEDCTEKVFSRGRGYYTLILCDLHMPKKDGYEACMQIREWEAQEPGFRRMPIIALSANVMSEVQDKCTEAGFDAFVTKPVDFIELSNVLAQFF